MGEFLKDQEELDNYYYCTKTIKLPLKNVVADIYNFFNSHNSTTLKFDEVYFFLSKKYNISSFNRGNLAKLLNTHTIIPFNTVKELYIQTNVAVKSKELYNFDLLENIFCKFRKKMVDYIEVLGIDVLTHLIKYGLSNFIYTLNSFNIHFDCGKSEIKLINESNDKLLSSCNTEMILELLSMFKESEWVAILKDDKLTESYIKMFIEDKRKEVEKLQSKDVILAYCDYINKDNYSARIEYLFPHHISQIFFKNRIIFVKDIFRINKDVGIELYPYLTSVVEIIKSLQQSIPERLNEKFKYLLQMVNKDYVPNSLWENYVSVLENRADGLTLKESSEHLGLTRERSRQIERKYQRLFDELYNKETNFTRKIRAFVADPLFITEDDIKNLFPFNPKAFKFLLENKEDDDLGYLEEINKFYYLDSYDWYKELNDYSDKMPDQIEGNQVKHYVNSILNELNKHKIVLNYKDCEDIIMQDYKLHGKFYSKTTLNFAKKFRQIMKVHYPNPVNIYDKGFLDSFKKHYFEMYGEHKFKTDHAIASVFTRICILADRGSYILADKMYMSEELANKIYNYIKESKRELFLTNNLFAIFEQDLMKESIGNKYFMQGALKQRLGSKLYFKRDYISITEINSNYYDDIYNYIRNANRVVTYSDLCEEYLGVTDVVIGFAVAQEGIITYRRKYVHVDNLNVSEKDREYLYKSLLNLVQDSKIHHVSDLYTYIKLTNKDILNKFYIEDSYSLFSLLEYLFSNEFEIHRPFLAQKGISIQNQADRINRFIYSSDEVDINDIIYYVTNNKLHLYSISELVDSLDDYVFKNENTIISLNKTNLNKFNTEIVEDLVLRTMGENDFVFADELNIYSVFPKEVEWNHWVLYSALNKFGHHLKAIPSDKVFKQKNKMRARPLIIRREIEAKDINEFISYLKVKLKLNDIEFYKYLRRKGLVD